MPSETLNTIISIAGTLLGTVLGWFLNELSSRGRLVVILKEIRYQTSQPDGYAGHTWRIIDAPQTNGHVFGQLQIHNSSATNKILYNPEFCIDSNGFIASQFPQVLNIAPHSILPFDFSFYIDEKINIGTPRKLSLVFKDHRHKQRTIRLAKYKNFVSL